MRQRFLSLVSFVHRRNVIVRVSTFGSVLWTMRTPMRPDTARDGFQHIKNLHTVSVAIVLNSVALARNSGGHRSHGPPPPIVSRQGDSHPFCLQISWVTFYCRFGTLSSPNPYLFLILNSFIATCRKRNIS